MSLSRVRGVRDILEEGSKKFEKVLTHFKSTTSKAGYSHIILPTLEESSLFIRSLGDSSDIVSKEMFSIKDQSYVLRPEGTAGTIRAYLMNIPLGEKKMWSYYGSMFRHEKPQSGRFREFYQFGIENISNSISPLVDAEVISLANEVLKELGVESSLEINTLGCENTRKAYCQELKKYFEGKKLSELSRKRLQQGAIMRILDSKEQEDQDIISQAPPIIDFLTEQGLDYYKQVKNTLKELNVEYIENPRLVRGLDYYSNICFEFMKNSKAIIGGGRYDNLGGLVDKSKKMGGIGWAAGLDRICDIISFPENKRPICLIPVGTHNTLKCLQIAQSLRRSMDFEVRIKTEAQSLKQHLGTLKNLNPCFIVFVGDDELAKGLVTVKNCDKGEQKIVKLDEVLGKANEIFKM